MGKDMLIYVLSTVASASSLVAIMYILYSKRLEKQIKLEDELIDELHMRYSETSDKLIEMYRELIISYESKKEEP